MADLHARRGWETSADRPAGSGYGPRPKSGRPRVDYSGRPAANDDIVEKIAWLMDGAIPLGGGWSIGLDPLLGLVPGLGDLASTAVSSVIVVQGFRAGVPKATLVRMVANVGIDAILGAIPFLGDAFDFVFRANTRNLQLYREAMAGVRDSRKDVTFLVLLLLILALVVAVPVILVIWAVQYTLPALIGG